MPATASVQDQTASRFVVAALPPIESIDVNTDVTVFLRDDVPTPMRVAALRRVWTVDPAIRDFRGLQESDWDFSDPDSIPGFGELGPEIDVVQLVADILGERRQVAALAPGPAPSLIARVVRSLF